MLGERVGQARAGVIGVGEAVTLGREEQREVEGYRLADTDDTRAGLSDTLAEHRRALGVAPISQFAKAPSLGDGGRTLFAVGNKADLLTWPVMALDRPGVGAQLGSEWAQPSAFDASPTDALVAAAGTVRRGPWFGVADAEGSAVLRLSGDEVGGSPFELSFTPDGRHVDLLVSAPPAGGRVRWRMVQVDVPGGAHGDTGIAGTVAAQGPLLADVSDDARIAAIWPQDGSGRPALVDLSSGHQVTLGPPDRPGVVLGYRALSSGAAELWDDGIVTLYDLAGRTVEQLVAQERPDRSAVRDVVLAPDRTWGATVGDGADVRLWRVNPQTGIWTPRESLPGHGGDVGEAEIDAVHRRLITIGLGDRVIVWDARLDEGSAAAPRAPTGGDLLRAACEVAGRDLSRAEWRRYVPGRLWRPTCTDVD